MLSNIGNVLGICFAIGLILSLKPVLILLFQREAISILIKRFNTDEEFAFKMVVALTVGSALSLLIGLGTKSAVMTAVALIAGLFVGLKVSESILQGRSVEYDLRLRLASGTFVDVVALCVSSGMPIRRAIWESTEKSSKEVQEVWFPITKDLSAETPLLSHLLDISKVNSENVMGRISRTLLISQERGTPIAQTLQSLSGEIRSETRRQLLEIAAKKDVAMMVPVVFGILPSITAIALYPAFISLSIM
jgi:tight adherence protein C